MPPPYRLLRPPQRAGAQELCALVHALLVDTGIKPLATDSRLWNLHARATKLTVQPYLACDRLKRRWGHGFPRRPDR